MAMAPRSWGRATCRSRARTPTTWAAPRTDSGTVPNLKYSFATAHNRLLPGGWAREVTTRELPIATELAGVNMRLDPGAAREMHWHKEAEWAYMLAGRARIKRRRSAGRTFVDDVGVGNLWGLPGGHPCIYLVGPVVGATAAAFVRLPLACAGPVRRSGSLRLVAGKLAPGDEGQSVRLRRALEDTRASPADPAVQGRRVAQRLIADDLDPPPRRQDAPAQPEVHGQLIGEPLGPRRPAQRRRKLDVSARRHDAPPSTRASDEGGRAWSQR